MDGEGHPKTCRHVSAAARLYPRRGRQMPVEMFCWSRAHPPLMVTSGSTEPIRLLTKTFTPRQAQRRWRPGGSTSDASRFCLPSFVLRMACLWFLALGIPAVLHRCQVQTCCVGKSKQADVLSRLPCVCLPDLRVLQEECRHEAQRFREATPLSSDVTHSVAGSSLCRCSIGWQGRLYVVNGLSSLLP